MIYFTADTHFGHKNIIGSCARPFQNVEEMDEIMIARWNERVTANDKVYIMGDMFFRCQNPEEILQRLRGRKYLIIGNHDDSWMKKVDLTKYFVGVDHYLQFSDGAHAITLCHYPLLTWKKSQKTYMIHGHIHANTNSDYWPLICARNNVLNAGVDIHDFRPVAWNELVENNRRFKAMHGIFACVHEENMSDEIR